MDPEFETKVRNSWNQDIKGRKMYQLVGNLKKLKLVSQRLNKERFNEVELKSEMAGEKHEQCQTNILLDPLNRWPVRRRMKVGTII